MLAAVPGGREVLDWFGGTPEFHDAELDVPFLSRVGGELRLLLPNGAVTFLLGDWIDVSLRGFSRQIVIGGLRLRRAGERDIVPWELGVGIVPGDIEIELEPCFGAYGSIRARLMSVVVDGQVTALGRRHI